MPGYRFPLPAGPVSFGTHQPASREGPKPARPFFFHVDPEDRLPDSPDAQPTPQIHPKVDAESPPLGVPAKLQHGTILADAPRKDAPGWRD